MKKSDILMNKEVPQQRAPKLRLPRPDISSTESTPLPQQFAAKPGVVPNQEGVTRPLDRPVPFLDEKK